MSLEALQENKGNLEAEHGYNQSNAEKALQLFLNRGKLLISSVRNFFRDFKWIIQKEVTVPSLAVKNVRFEVEGRYWAEANRLCDLAIVSELYHFWVVDAAAIELGGRTEALPEEEENVQAQEEDNNNNNRNRLLHSARYEEEPLAEKANIQIVNIQPHPQPSGGNEGCRSFGQEPPAEWLVDQQQKADVFLARIDASICRRREAAAARYAEEGRGREEPARINAGGRGICGQGRGWGSSEQIYAGGWGREAPARPINAGGHGAVFVCGCGRGRGTSAERGWGSSSAVGQLRKFWPGRRAASESEQYYPEPTHQEKERADEVLVNGRGAPAQIYAGGRGRGSSMTQFSATAGGCGASIVGQLVQQQHEPISSAAAAATADAFARAMAARPQLDALVMADDASVHPAPAI